MALNLTVAATRRREVPAIFMEQSKHFTHRHAANAGVGSNTRNLRKLREVQNCADLLRLPLNYAAHKTSEVQRSQRCIPTNP